MCRKASQRGNVSGGMTSLVSPVCVCVCVCVCVNEYYAALPSSHASSSDPLVCRDDRVTRGARRVGLMGMDWRGADIE